MFMFSCKIQALNLSTALFETLTDWELLTILLRTLIPLFFFLVFGVVSVVCIYMHRKKRRAQYMGKSADGSTPTPFSFGSPSLENYPTAPPPQQFSSFEPAKSY